MKQKNKVLTRGIAGALCLTLVGTLSFVGLTNLNTASAVTSLPHITNIVTSQQTFNILEIVPESGSGSMGYYADGQEPYKDWQTVLAATTNPADREAYANGIFSGLAASALLSRDTTTPLTYTGSSADYTYDEMYYWEMTPSELAARTLLKLDARETVSLGGTFSPNSAGTGLYKGIYNYIFYATGEKDYVQDVDRFEYNGTSGSYFYNPIFTALTPDNLGGLTGRGIAAYIDHCVLYGQINADGTIFVSAADPAHARESAVTYYLKSAYGPAYEEISALTDFLTLAGKDIYVADGSKVYYADIDADISLNATSDYYYVSDTGAPQTAPDGTHPYAAVSSAYIEAVPEGSGWFDREITGYSFLPAGGGDADYDPNTTGTVAYPVDTDVVYYQGTISNNNWFLRYVFDIENPVSSSIKVNVQTVTPSQLTADMVSAADLLSLSGGFAPSNPGATLAASYNAANDLTEALAYTLYSAATTGKCPLLVDYPLTTLDGGLNITKLAQLALLYTDTAVSQADFAAHDTASWSSLLHSNFVTGNIYCFNAPFDSGNGTILNVATSLFNSAFSGATASSDAFSAVLTEIKRENFLRQVDNPATEDLLPEQVSVANTIRYIINYAGQRATTNKTRIKVLDIEPGNATTGALSKLTLRGWLGPDSGYSDDNITITTMSTAEFIGKIEDINETYDLVYIGTSLDGFNTASNGTTDYNDNTMDGVIYAGIGDTYRASPYMGGLLDRDYASTTALDYSSTLTSNLFRFSGNDITAAKAEELLYFAQGGYPVIMANDIFLPSVSTETSAFTVTATASVSGTNVTLTASAVDSTSHTAMSATYRWYKTGSDTVLSTNKIYTFSAVSGTSHYYCVATAASNPASDATSNTIIVNWNPNVTAAVDTTSARETGSYGGTIFFDAALSYSPTGEITENDTMTITARAVERTSRTTLTGVSTTYQWYDNNSLMTNQTNQTLTITPKTSLGHSYYCRVTVNGSSVAARSATFWFYQQNKVRNWIVESYYFSTIGSYTVPAVTFHAAVTASTSGGTVNLAAAPVNATTGAALSGTFRYNWYYEGSGTSFSSDQACSVTLPTGVTSRIYYCRIYPSIGTDYARSYNIVVTGSGVTATDSTSGSVGGTYHPTVYTSGGSVDAARVDNTSFVYQAITGIKDRANVMSVSEIDAPTLLNYLKLSKPEIVFTGTADYPTVYSNSSGTMTAMTAAADGLYYLTYNFTIKNDTDPTPASTTYDCRLALDLNADGRYAEAERLDDITVKAGSNVIFPALNSDGDEYYRLFAGVPYTVTRQVPTQYVGILPWQLEVVKNGAARIHASAHNYTRIAPMAAQREQIKILQINSNSSALLDLEAQQTKVSSTDAAYSYAMQAADGQRYKGIYGKLLADVTDFNVTIITQTANDLEAKTFRDFTAPDAATTDSEKIYSYLDTFDMVIIGFDDVYAEVGRDTATAITTFIDSGKSILFTHDTTSFSNTSFNPAASTSYTDKPAYWGYFFNTIIRDKVGLDRFGITSTDTVNSVMLRNILKDEKDGRGGTDGTTNTNLTSAEITGIHGSDHSVAFDFDATAAAGTVAETQGFTNYALLRFDSATQLNQTSNVSSGNQRETPYVSQVNEGQITTYPYDINTAAFNDIQTDGNANYMTVGKTHEQYYQLNMNSDDIVVWYCLSAGSNTSGYYYNDRPNDVTNAYYIFNKGNVTYSGVGHNYGSASDLYVKTSSYDSIPDEIQNEAKLFVNTMIAAYQTGKQAPSIKIVDSVSSSMAASPRYFLADYAKGGIVEKDLVDGNAERALYFAITDTNLNADKVITAQYFYDIGDGIKRAFTPEKINITDANNIYKANGAVAATIQGGKVYIIYLPDLVLNALGQSNVSAVTITIEVTTTMGTLPPLIGADTISLRKIELFQLK